MCSNITYMIFTYDMLLGMSREQEMYREERLERKGKRENILERNERLRYCLSLE